MPGPPGIVLGRRTGPVGRVLAVSGGLQLGEDACGQPIAGTRRGEQSAAGQLAERGIGVGVSHERRQMRLVRHLAAERDREVQGVARGPAEPGGEQRGGRGTLAEARQRYVVAVGVLAEGVEGIVDGPPSK